MISRLPAIVAFVVVSLSLAVAGAFFAPVRLGGDATYAVTRGSSMAPRFKSGDLVVIKRVDEVHVGDVAAYRSPLTKQLVVHRIIAERDGRFVFKGDNNSWIDTYEPTSGEIVGKLWIHTHGAGAVLNSARNPWFLGAFGGLFAMTLAGTQPDRRRSAPGARSREMKRTRGGAAVFVGSTAQLILATLAVVTAVFGLVSLIAFRSPTTTTVPTTTKFEEHAVFSYEGSATEGLYYENLQLQTGDPIYVHLVPVVTFGLAYELSAPGAQDLHGTIRYVAVLRDVNGWERSLDLVPTTPFEGTSASVSSAIDFPNLMAAAAQAQAETGSPSRQQTVAITAEVILRGSLDGVPFESYFNPFYTLRINLPDEIYVETAATRDFEKVAPVSNETLPDPFHQSQSLSVTTTQHEPNTLGLGVTDVRVEQLRLFGGVVTLTSLAALVVSATLMVVTLARSKANRVHARYGTQLVHVETLFLPPTEQRIAMSTMSDLVRVANRLQTVILWIHREGGESYLVMDGERTYIYHVNEGRPRQSEASS